MKVVTYQDFFGGRLKLRHLVVVLTIAEEGSTVAAAERLFVSQPAITRLVRELEDMVGAPLFERTSTGMRPTPYAGPFLEHARAALSHVKHAAQHVQEMSDGESGVVTIGVHLAGASALLPRAIASLKAEAPAIDVVVHDRAPDDLLSQLAHGELDLLLTRLTVGGPREVTFGEQIIEHEVHTERMVVVCGAGSPWSERPDLGLGDLVEEPWVLPTRSTTLREELERAFRRAGVGLPRNVVECTSPIIVGSLVGHHGFVGILPQTVLGALAGLQPLDIVDCEIRSGIGALRPADHPVSPTTQRFLDHLARAGREIGGSPERT